MFIFRKYISCILVLSFMAISLNMVGQNKKIRGHRVAIELLTPLSQNLNGLQMEKGTSLILAYQKAW